MEMKAWLMMRGLWMLVSGEGTVPASTDLEGVQDWKLRGQKAAGVLFLALEHEQRVHLGGIESDPIAIWSKLDVLARVSMLMMVYFRSGSVLMSLCRLL